MCFKAGLLHADGPLRHAEPRIFFAATPITAAFAVAPFRRTSLMLPSMNPTKDRMADHD